MIIKSLDVALGAVRVAPCRAFQKTPPLTPIAKINRVVGWSENQRAREQHMRQCAWVILRVGWNFRKRHMPGRVDEFLELPVCDWLSIDPEAADGDAMNRRLFRIMLLGSHAKRAAWDSNHDFSGVNVGCITVGKQIGLALKRSLNSHKGKLRPMLRRGRVGP